MNSPKAFSKALFQERRERRVVSCCKLFSVRSFFFKLGFTCVSMLCQFLLCRKVNQLFVYIPSFLDFLPIQVTTEHRVEFPVLYNRFSLVLYFKHSRVYMSTPISKFIPPPCPPCVHTFVLYICVSISALQISVPFFLDSIYLHKYMIFVFSF